MKIFPLIQSVFVVVLACIALTVSAADKPTPPRGDDVTPHQVVETVTTKLMTAVKNGRDALKTNPEKYYADIQVILEQAVNFKFIARNVMGAYWDKATPEQQDRFVETFKKSMVETYAKGMASFADLKIEVEPPEGEIPAAGKVSVIQKVTAADNVNRIAYTMARPQQGNWQLINVVLDGVNLGKTFRSQFAQAVKAQQGNLDAAINSWSAQS